MEDVKAVVEKAMLSEDPVVREQAVAYRNWSQAENALDAARAAVVAEEDRFRSRRINLEAAVTEANNGAAPVHTIERQHIADAQARIDAVDARVEAARAALAQAVADHTTVMDGLHSAVRVAEGVDARRTAEFGAAFGQEQR